MSALSTGRITSSFQFLVSFASSQIVVPETVSASLCSISASAKSCPMTPACVRLLELLVADMAA